MALLQWLSSHLQATIRNCFNRTAAAATAVGAVGAAAAAAAALAAAVAAAALAAAAAAAVVVVVVAAAAAAAVAVVVRKCNFLVFFQSEIITVHVSVHLSQCICAVLLVTFDRLFSNFLLKDPLDLADQRSTHHPDYENKTKQMILLSPYAVNVFLFSIKKAATKVLTRTKVLNSCQ